MPTNLTGLVVFVALLAPGFCHLLVTERKISPGKSTPSALRELASLAVVSVAADGVAISVYLQLSRVWSDLPRLETFAFEAKAWKEDLPTGLALTFALVVISCLLAYAWAAADVGRRLHSRLGSTKATAWLLPRSSGEITPSWWQTLYAEQPDKLRLVACTLTDGTTVTGYLLSFNRRADEVGDRDIVLSAPIEVRAGTIDAVAERFNYGSIVISARDMRLMRVEYHEHAP